MLTGLQVGYDLAAELGWIPGFESGSSLLYLSLFQNLDSRSKQPSGPALMVKGGNVKALVKTFHTYTLFKVSAQ